MPPSRYTIKALYHFTDTRNIPSIKTHGILSNYEIQRRNDVVLVAPGGNEVSRDADERFGVHTFVHLCFFDQHPMEFLAKQDGRIQRSSFLRIDPKILLQEGIMLCDGVANRANATLVTWEDAKKTLDWEIICTRTDWKNPDVQARLKQARKYEVLVPGCVPVEFIKGF